MKANAQQRAGVVLGWIAGAALGLLVDYALSVAIGSAYPIGATTFVCLAGGAFGGMAVADRLGPRAVRVLGPVAGVLLALAVLVLGGIVLAPPAP